MQSLASLEDPRRRRNQADGQPQQSALFGKNLLVQCKTTKQCKHDQQ
jgi:hypothetical protein